MNTSVVSEKSNFVTVLAWVLVVFGWLGVAVALMQNIMINFAIPAMESAAPPGTTAQAVFPLTGFRIMGALMLALSAFLTYAAYALLKRQNWARRTYVVIFTIGAIWNVVIIVGFSIGVFSGALFESGAKPAPPEMVATFKVMLVMFGLFALGVIILFGWLIKRLRSTAIKAEFSAVPSAT